jgi:hypothetical protein
MNYEPLKKSIVGLIGKGYIWTIFFVFPINKLTCWYICSYMLAWLVIRLWWFCNIFFNNCCLLIKIMWFFPKTQNNFLQIIVVFYVVYACNSNE